ncbi:MAG: hypothetical protein WDO18_19050 [Acidobacteriota bacterium]
MGRKFSFGVQCRATVQGHHILEGNCAACHDIGGFFAARADQACTACHDGPIHKEQQTFVPSCRTCHAEHKGTFDLASSINDASCTQCHANLQTKSGKLTVASNVKAFDSSHPDFAALRVPDPGTIKLNHQVHMKPGLRGPDAQRNSRVRTATSPANAADAAGKF